VCFTTLIWGRLADILSFTVLHGFWEVVDENHKAGVFQLIR